MAPLARILTSAAGLVLLFGVAWVAGGALGAESDDRGRAEGSPAAVEAGHSQDRGAAHGDGGGHAADVRGEAGTASGTGSLGLAVSEGGLTLVVEPGSFEPGRPAEMRFSIRGEDGEPVRDFDLRHERRLHLIVARRDGSRFQHLHPTLDPDGTWRTSLTLADSGAYRVFADFSHEGRPRTLGADLMVNGVERYRPMPEPALSGRAPGGYAVALEAPPLRAGRDVELRFSIERNGEPVHTQPYLGAAGHLVGLREGDLAYLHTHPSHTEHGTGHDDAVVFRTRFPSPGRFRLYLQFRHDGEVRTAELTQDVEP